MVQARRIHRIVWATINYCWHPDESKQSFAVECILSLHARSNECLDRVLCYTSAICRNYVPCIYHTRSKRNVFFIFIYFPLINPIERSYRQYELSTAIFSYNTRNIYTEKFSTISVQIKELSRNTTYMYVYPRELIFLFSNSFSKLQFYFHIIHPKETIFHSYYLSFITRLFSTYHSSSYKISNLFFIFLFSASYDV